MGKRRAKNDLVLVVEDDVTFRRDLCGAIEDEGFAAVGASNGTDALHWLESGTIAPSVIVLDLVMEGMDGEALLARLAQSRTFKGIPVVLISGRPDVAEVAERVRARGVLAKPFLPDELLRVVKKLCS